MTLEFYNYYTKGFISEWGNWTGPLPEVGDFIIIHSYIDRKYEIVERMFDNYAKHSVKFNVKVV